MVSCSSVHSFTASTTPDISPSYNKTNFYVHINYLFNFFSYSANSIKIKSKSICT